MNKTIKVSEKILQELKRALDGESPRGMVMLSLSWIDHMLERKLATVFNKGSSKDQEAIFSVGGPFRSLSAKVKIARCAGWIGDDLLFNLRLLTEIRNDLAHRIEPCSPHASEIRTKLERLKTPYEIYSDWGRIRAADLPDGIVLYSGEKPEEAGAKLRLPGTFALKLALPAVVGILGKSFDVGLD